MRSHKPANWNEHLVAFDTDQIWKELHRIVAQHKLSRYSTKFDQLVDEGKFNRFTDQTQDLFLKLLEKNRFQHYIDTNMTDAEIEMEISQIELTNILTLEMRKRYPEAYRISRRILQLLQSDSRFKRFDTVLHHRVSEQRFGLSEWNELEVTWPINSEDKLEDVPFYTRDIRMAGCAGDSQIIISNPDLADLIKLVIEKIEAPLLVRDIRKYVMSRLTIMDINITPLESYVDDDEKPTFEAVDQKNNPEQDFVKSNGEAEAVGKVKSFLENLFKAVKQKQKQYSLVLNILQLYYLTPDLSQWDVSRKLEVSDSLISGYRKVIDQLLQDLGFTTIEEARKFQQELSNELSIARDNKFEE